MPKGKHAGSTQTPFMYTHIPENEADHEGLHTGAENTKKEGQPNMLNPAKPRCTGTVIKIKYDYIPELLRTTSAAEGFVTHNICYHVALGRRHVIISPQQRKSPSAKRLAIGENQR